MRGSHRPPRDEAYAFMGRRSGRTHEPKDQRATVWRFFDGSHEQLRRHLDDFLAVHNFGRRLKTREGLTLYEHICKRCTAQPERFNLHPIYILSTKCLD